MAEKKYKDLDSFERLSRKVYVYKQVIEIIEQDMSETEQFMKEGLIEEFVDKVAQISEIPDQVKEILKDSEHFQQSYDDAIESFRLQLAFYKNEILKCETFFEIGVENFIK